MSEEIIVRLPQGPEPPQSRRSIENHSCEREGCRKLGGFGFAKPTGSVLSTATTARNFF